MTISYKYLDTYSVGSIARTLWKFHGWDWDAAYCAAHAYRKGVSTTRTPAQALADINRSKPVMLYPRDVTAIEAAYRKAKTGNIDERR